MCVVAWRLANEEMTAKPDGNGVSGIGISVMWRNEAYGLLWLGVNVAAYRGWRGNDGGV